jgi:hypothetical protein
MKKAARGVMLTTRSCVVAEKEEKRETMAQTKAMKTKTEKVSTRRMSGRLPGPFRRFARSERTRQCERATQPAVQAAKTSVKKVKTIEAAFAPVPLGALLA